MPTNVTIHYGNSQAFADPHLWVRYERSAVSDDFVANGQDESGRVFTVQARRPEYRSGESGGSGCVVTPTAY